jgi:hypothetical protein
MAKNCSILSQKVPKFELYKHTDELFKKAHHYAYTVQILALSGLK